VGELSDGLDDTRWLLRDDPKNSSSLSLPLPQRERRWASARAFHDVRFLSLTRLSVDALDVSWNPLDGDPPDAQRRRTGEGMTFIDLSDGTTRLGLFFIFISRLTSWSESGPWSDPLDDDDASSLAYKINVIKESRKN
jgi:hypothetical protein